MHQYDIIIIGGGPAGLTAGLYASRSRMRTLLIEKMGCGGQAVITDWLENYPGFPDGIAGFELAGKMEEQARKFGLALEFDEVCELVLPANQDDDKIIRTTGGEYRASAVIVASGASHKMLNVPGEVPLRGKGVSYCATCDGPFSKDKDVAVIGGGNSAVQEAVYLTRFASTVTLIHRRDRLRATHILQERAKANNKIRFVWNSVVTEIKGADRVDSVCVRNLIDNSASDIAVNGVFVFVGLEPHSGFARGKLDLDAGGYISTDDTMHTSARGVFACGDVRKKLLRQVVTAAGEGATAAFAAQEYIEEVRGIAYK
jgi:thioredoxin reductase (NADPH)